MPPVTLEGDTLGNKRRHYNKLVEDAVANKQYDLCDISGDDSDIDNLPKIDIASRNRNVHYIIEVMKTKNMLYAATAIKKSTWLRVYWPNSLARDWTDDAYLLTLNKSIGQKAVIKGLFSLLHQSQIIDIAKQHIPDDNETDQN